MREALGHVIIGNAAFAGFDDNIGEIYMSENRVKHPEFAQRMKEVSAKTKAVPTLNRGRYTAIVNFFEDNGEKILKESVRQWYEGRSKPHGRRMQLLAECLGTSPEYLEFGTQPYTPPPPSGPRVPQAYLAQSVPAYVRVTAACIELAGNPVFFPPSPESPDLFAIIGGVQYAIRVTLVENEKKGLVFTGGSNLAPGEVLIGVEMTEPHCFRFHRIDTGQSQGGDRVPLTDSNSVIISSFAVPF